MLNNSQKEHLTYTAIGQVITLFALWLFAYQYIIPGIPEISALSKSWQNAIDTYHSTLKSGISFETMEKLLQGKPERAELVKIIQSDVPSARKIIQKPENITKNYLEWIKGEIGNSEQDRNILKIEKAKLNSIIPTMSPLSSNIEEDNITLRQYVRFIESTILKQFNFNTNVLIGMQGITFWAKGTSIPENLWTFEFRLDFTSRNEDIIKFIDFINSSGKPDILSSTWVTPMTKVPEVMSNPLITMESLSIQEKLDPDKPDKENSWRVTLRFYVRGISTSDITFLKENLKIRQEKLKWMIDENVKICEKDTIYCNSYMKKLQDFQQKYREYLRSYESVKLMVSGSDEIYGLNQSVNTLKSLEKELESILPKAKK